MELPFYVINAFTQQDFAGNPAAVMPLVEFLPTQTMQNIAAQNNLSETAFVVDKGDHFDIRWFSPKTEIAFCGHATLASAFVLFQLRPDTAHLAFYAEAVGDFSVTQLPCGKIKMTFPQRHVEPTHPIPEALLKGLAPPPEEVYQDDQAYYVRYPDEQSVRTASYQRELLESLAPLDVCVTAQAKDYDFISRYFWPANGGEEDPTTGSAHTSLAPFWAKQLNKTSLHAFQTSPRGGEVFCELTDEKVIICGYSRLFSKGTVYL